MLWKGEARTVRAAIASTELEKNSPHHTNVPRRDYTRVEVLVCSECGGDQVFPPRQEKDAENWYRRQTPEEMARLRKERKEKDEKDKERRAARKQRHAPRVEKKDLRKEQRKETDEAADEIDTARDGEGEEDEPENEASGQESEESLAEGDDSECEEEGENEEGEEGEYESSGDEAEEDDEVEEEEEGEEVECVEDNDGEKEPVTEGGHDEGDQEEDGNEEEGKVIHSQERGHVAAKQGRVIVTKPFKKGACSLCSSGKSAPCELTRFIRRVVVVVSSAGQYPMYRETNWKYSSPCMCCLHSQGPMWILKGMGEKSKGKTKGFRKIQRRDFKNTLKGEI
jgi:hypothetical protein